MRLGLTLGQALVAISLLLLASVGSIPTAHAQECPHYVWPASPPPIVTLTAASRENITVWARGAWITTVQATGSMRPAIQDGSKVVLIPPEPKLLVPGRAIVFRHPLRADQAVLHRIVGEGVDSDVPALLLGTGPTGWTLAWNGQWYGSGVTPPSPPPEAHYWRTKGDNNCLVDSWQVRYRDVFGVLVAVVE